MQYDIHLHIWLAGKVVQYHCGPAQSVSSGAVSDAIHYRLHQIYYIWSCFIKIAEKRRKRLQKPSENVVANHGATDCLISGNITKSNQTKGNVRKILR